MLIYACKYEINKKFQFFIGKDINLLLTPYFWEKDQILEIFMFRVHDTYQLDVDEYNSETLEVLCQEMITLQK